ncbi:MAG: GGDEF domain-containing protein [Pseudomonadota bacterium]|nr:GGDEF domain-containing protein [Pseudomonadota bacterium]
MQLPATFQLEFTTSYLSIGVVAALALTVIAALARVVVLHVRLSRSSRDLTAELAAAHEHARALEAHNQTLSRQRVALATANQRLKRLVAIDPLTGIANRRHFDRVLDREVRRARRQRQPLSLIFLDLDQFKRFNDTFGHADGDGVLRRVARTLDESFRRGGDLVARYGGEEFAVILPGVAAHRAGLYAERLRRRVWRMAIATGTTEPSDRITISAGVATIAPDSPGFLDAAPDTLLRAADQALYRAKCQGRNRVCMAGASPASTPDDRPRVELAS